MDKFIKGINKTGFGLEFGISKILNENEWSVINNKYYIDDVQGSAREIDILAYKVSIVNKIQVYTVLIISCKKSIENSWALLAKSKNENDPNIDWEPVTMWSNQRIIKLIIDQFSWKENYVSECTKLKKDLFSPKNHIFAFQELNSKKGNPKNDKNIYNSIVSAMKSQDYEIGSLDERKQDESVYNFNLISIVDAPLMRLQYEDKSIKAKEIDSDIYVGSYIINKKETISRIHFITAKNFPSHLDIYNELHSHNKKQTNLMIKSYYENCMENEAKVNLFINDFNKELKWDIYLALNELLDDAPKINDVKLDIIWDSKKKCVALSINKIYADKDLELINNDQKITELIAQSLLKFYQYAGGFYFDSGVPF